jgi:adenine-specific DNA-methyltransferase
MKNIDDESVDLICTSPPYKANKSYESWGSFEEYEDFADQWIQQAARVLTPTGTMMLNVGYTKMGRNQTLPLTYLYHKIASNYGLKLVQEIVWRYGGGLAYKLRYTHRSERIMWLTKDPDNCTFNLEAVRVKDWKAFDKRNNPNGKNPTDVWEINTLVGGTAAGANKFNHPAQFPPLLVERIIKAHSNEGELVFDPFMGTGTTAIVAKELKRDCFGCELLDEYIEICSQRGMSIL